MKKTLVWALMFAVLSSYSFQVLSTARQESVAVAYATTGNTHYDAHDRASAARERAEERRSNAFKRAIERLTFRKEAAEEKCEELSSRRAEVYCKKVKVYERLILILTSHVS